MSDNNGCPHNEMSVGWDYSTCRKCGSVRTDSQWGIASLKWFESIEYARFYQANGRIPERISDNGIDAELNQLRADNETLRRELQDFEADTECEDRCAALESENAALRARVAELERDRVHAGVDICEVAAAVEVVRAVEIVKEVAGVVANLHEGPFRHGFEAACEEIEHRLRPCEHCDAALAKDGA